MDIVFYDLDAYVEPCQTSAMELFCENQKQPFRGVLEKWCSENIQQIYIRTPMPKCDFNKCNCNFIEIALWDGCSPVNLLHNFRTPFRKNTSGWLLLENK